MTIMHVTGRREITAAVLRAAAGELLLEPICIDQPRADEVLIRIHATGICHADAHIRDGLFGVRLPVVLGHEGAGVVEAVGEGVRKVAAGDHVVLTFDSCGLCPECLGGRPTACEQAFALNFACARLDGSHALHDAAGPVSDRFFGQSSFASYAIATERNVVKVPRDVPLELLGPLGCGVQTGAGAVLNTFGLAAGETIAIFGAGSVGLSAVMAAKLSAATTIVAVDVVPARLDLARELGATHVIDGQSADVPGAIRAVSGLGVHYVLDTTGNVAVVRLAIDALRPYGTCGILGSPRDREDLHVDPVDLIRSSKTIRGIVSGDSVPDTFIPRLIELFSAGLFPFDRLIRFYPLDRINEAFDDCATGVTIKPIIRFDVD